MDVEQRQKKTVAKTQAGTAKKLRSACDFCHQTKVKCSGGKPCNGCSQLSIECIYSASNRIGRPKGSRNKKTIERVKRYKLESEERQRAQLAAEQAALDGSAPPEQTSHMLQNSSESETQSSSAMTVDWTASTPLEHKVEKNDTSDLFPFPCDPDATVVAPVDPVYSLYTGHLGPDLPDFDFGQDPSPLFQDIDTPQFHPFTPSEPIKGTLPLDSSAPSPPSSTAFSANDKHGALSATLAALSPSSPLYSPHTTPTLTSASSIVSEPTSTCRCLQDQASLLSRLASTSLHSAPLALDAALECAQRAIRIWDCFLRCRHCSYRLFESKFDSYLVLTSSMRIVLNMLNDQLRHFDHPDAERTDETCSTNQDASPLSPAVSTGSSASHCHRDSRSWTLGVYEPSGFENQLISATLLSKIAGSIVRLSDRLLEVTSQTNIQPFSLDTPPESSSTSPTENSAPTDLPSKEGTGRSYLMDHDMDDTAMGFNIKFLQHKALSNDRSARRFKEEISARVSHLV